MLTTRMLNRGRGAVAAAMIAALVGITAQTAAADTDRKHAKPARESVVAQATVPSVTVYKQPDGADVKVVLPNPTEAGGPRVFLVSKQRADGWLRVYLPLRPNHSRGWIRTSDVRLARNPYRVTVSYAKHRITVFKSNDRFLREKVALGRKDVTPTPGGVYYLAELYDVPNDAGPYGPFAFALSGFSETLRSFKGGDAIIGIHGTNQPQLLGQDVSHGCIRMSNEGVTALAQLLPLGTPVRITKR